MHYGRPPGTFQAVSRERARYHGCGRVMSHAGVRHIHEVLFSGRVSALPRFDHNAAEIELPLMEVLSRVSMDRGATALDYRRNHEVFRES